MGTGGELRDVMFCVLVEVQVAHALVVPLPVMHSRLCISWCVNFFLEERTKNKHQTPINDTHAQIFGGEYTDIHNLP